MDDLNDKATGNNLQASEWNQPASELQNIIENTGQTLSGADLNQAGKGVAQYVANGNFYTDSGTANNYVLSSIGLKQATSAYVNGMAIEFIAGNTNTAASTVNVAGLGVKNIVDTAGGEIVAGARYNLRYRTGTGDFEILSASVASEIQSITGTVAANALTLGLKEDILDFRSSSLTVGIPNSRLFGDLSLVVPSGATLGTVNAIQSRLILLAIDNSGTVELAVVNLSGGVNLDETTLITTVAIDAAADSNNVIYSAVARVNVPFRVVGFIESTQAVAGTWATNPSALQGTGGNALTSMSSLGYGQTWQSVTRTSGVTYYNTIGKPIFLSARLGTSNSLAMTIGGHGFSTVSTSASNTQEQAFIIPSGSSYSAVHSGGVTFKELR